MRADLVLAKASKAMDRLLQQSPNNKVMLVESKCLKFLKRSSVILKYCFICRIKAFMLLENTLSNHLACEG